MSTTDRIRKMLSKEQKQKARLYQAAGMVHAFGATIRMSVTIQNIDPQGD